jgi:Zn-finger protein
MAQTVGLSFVASTRAKSSKGVSFGHEEGREDGVQGWKIGFEGKLESDGIQQQSLRASLFARTCCELHWPCGFAGNDLGKCLCFFQSVLNQMSTMEEMIKQWEVFHQSIETRIDERVVRHVDDKLSAMLLDPSCVVFPFLLPKSLMATAL